MGIFGWNISICEASCKIKKCLHLGQKNALFGYFRARIRKSHCHIWNQRPQICLIPNLVQNKRSLNLGSKIPNLSIFDQKCLIWVFLGHNLEKTIVIFEISTLDFVHGVIILNRRQLILNNSVFLYLKIYCNRQVFHLIRAPGISMKPETLRHEASSSKF